VSQTKNIWHYVDQALDHFATILFIFFFICVLLQVLFRYVFQIPLTWSEEAARYLNMWAVFIGAAIGVHRRDHLRVDLIDRWLGKVSSRTRMAFYAFVTMLSSVSMVALLIGGAIMTRTSWDVELTMIPLPQGVLYLAAVFSSGLMTLFFLRQLASEGIALARGEEGA
jgi:TRAP-type C4-dicarboxylate transport system permease small subunit